jgi:hypothetical protein
VSTEAVPSQVTADGTAPARRVGTRHAPLLGAVLSAVVATGVVLSGVRGSGHRLVRDFVAVPVPAAPESVLPSSASALRAWPLDALAWAASWVLPTAGQQVVLLVSTLLLAGMGAGLLVRRSGTAAAVAAAWVAVWNPYVTERLLLGQVPTLLAYACLPWIVLVGRSRLSSGRRMALLFVVALPAAVTPWGGVTALAAAVLVELSRPDRTWRRVVAVAALGVVWCGPWLVPALLAGGVPADPDGAVAFALADDSGLGLWVSALVGGGVWASGAQPLSRSDPVALTASLALLALALVGCAVLASRSTTRGVVALVALVAPATLAWWASGPGLDLVTSVQQLPGLALLRDQHRMLAPSVMALAVLVGVAVGWVGDHGGDAASALVGALVIALAVASVPDLPRALHTAYRPVGYPAEWDAVVGAVSSGDGTPVVLSLPWQPLRRPAWAGNPAFLDPLPRAVPGTTLVSTALSVERDGTAVVVDDTPLGEVWGSGEVSAASLRRHGVTHVVEWLGTPGQLATAHDGWRLVHAGAAFRVWDVTSAS